MGISNGENPEGGATSQVKTEIGCRPSFNLLWIPIRATKADLSESVFFMITTMFITETLGIQS